MKKIINEREYYFPDDTEFYDELPIREVNLVMINEELTVEVITVRQLEYDAVEVKHIFTLEEWFNKNKKTWKQN